MVVTITALQRAIGMADASAANSSGSSWTPDYAEEVEELSSDEDVEDDRPGPLGLSLSAAATAAPSQFHAKPRAAAAPTTIHHGRVQEKSVPSTTNPQHAAKTETEARLRDQSQVRNSSGLLAWQNLQ